MNHHFTMHDTLSGSHANKPVQNDITKLTASQKHLIIKDNILFTLSIDDLAAKHNCTYAVIDYVINNY